MNMHRLTLLVLALSLVLLPMAALADDDDITVTVTGTATFTVEADTAVLSIGVESQAADASEASRQNANAVAAVRKALTEAGIPEDDIRTNYFYVNTLYRYDEATGTSVVSGYAVSNSLSVTVRDITRVGEIIDIALKSGANSCDGISYSSSSEDLNDEALMAAVREARRKAALVAEAAGLQLGDVISITENTSTYVGVNYARAKGAAMDTEEAEADYGTSITPGRLTFSATVTVTFSLKK